ncbi:hypothetical protein [Leptotrichia shahii]|nr:hypothetical protein [Leptotrichia shahii]
MSIGTEKVLYVIGNGFDLNLGLKTSYNDFFEYIDINNMKNIINVVREDRKNIEKYDKKRLEYFSEKLKKYDYELKENNFLLKLEESINEKNQKQIKENIYCVHKEIISTLKSRTTNRFVDEYGVFIIFLLLIKVEKNEWQWVEEQILCYIQDLIEIFNNRFNELTLFIKDNWNDLELELEKIIKLVRLSFRKSKFEKVKKRYLKNFNENEKIKRDNMESVLKIILKKTEEYFNNKISIKEYQNYVENLIFEIEYLNFLLEILFTDYNKDIDFKKDELKIINKNDKKCIYLKEQLNIFENYFGEYVLKINNDVKNILTLKDISGKINKNKSFENKFLRLEIQNKETEVTVDKALKKKMASKIIKSINNFFKNGKEKKYIINFNYTNYLNEFINDKNNLNIEEMININGDINDFTGNPKIYFASIENEIKKIMEVSQLNYKSKSLRYTLTLLNSVVPNLKNIEIKSTKGKNIIDELNNLENNIKKEINKIGKIESNLIFGIDDVQIKDEFIKEILKGFIKKNRRKELEEKWKKLIETNNFSKIYFYGHSFADADYTFFEDLFDLINLENNKAIKLIFLYSSGFSCERSVNSLIKKYALKKHKEITKLKNKLEIKEIN